VAARKNRTARQARHRVALPPVPLFCPHSSGHPPVLTCFARPQLGLPAVSHDGPPLQRIGQGELVREEKIL